MEELELIGGTPLVESAWKAGSSEHNGGDMACRVPTCGARRVREGLKAALEHCKCSNAPLRFNCSAIHRSYNSRDAHGPCYRGLSLPRRHRQPSGHPG